MSVTESTTSAIAQIQQVAATMSGLGQSLDAAASSGQFGSIFSQINSELAQIGHAPAATSTSTSSASTGTTLSGTAFTGSLAGSTAGSTVSGSGRATGRQAVADAQKYLGIPYVWGGTDPSVGLDCSGLVQRVYKDLGVSLPRTSQEQAKVGTPVDRLADAQPGDLVFFAGSDGTDSAPGHVGIYIGNGQMIDAPYTGVNVRVDPVGQPVAIRRVVSGAAAPALSADLSSLSGTASGATDAQLSSIGTPTALQGLFLQAGSRYGVSPLLLAAVAKQESGFSTTAESGAGAQGLMQLMPGTAAGLGVNPDDPAQAVDGAAQLLSGYLKQYNGSIPMSLAAYNAGPGAVAQYGGVPPYGETQAYVRNITATLESAS